MRWKLKQFVQDYKESHGLTGVTVCPSQKLWRDDYICDGKVSIMCDVWIWREVKIVGVFSSIIPFYICFNVYNGLFVLSLKEEEEQEEEDDDEDDDDTDDLDELDTDQLMEAELEEDENNENAGEDGENDFSPSDDEELATLLEEGDEGEDEDSDADEEVELILGDSKCACPVW